MPIKVKDMPYVRADADAVAAAMKRCAEAVRRAHTQEELLAAHKEYQTLTDAFTTARNLADIRFTQDTRDGYYTAEREYYDAATPALELVGREYCEAVLSHPLRDALGATNRLMLASMRNSLAATDPAIEDDLCEENRLVTEYDKLLSGLLYTFRGKSMPMTLLKKHMAATDRETRREAYEALGATLEQNSEALDTLFDRLVKVRTRMAKKLGYDSFTTLGYYRMNRLCYDRDAIERLRGNILNSVVPAVVRLKSALAQRMGIKEIKLYDDGVTCPSGNPDPVLDRDGIFRAAVEMYHDLGEETADFIDEMIAADALDVESREGKWGGGYCTEIPGYKQPFILANFNGTSADIDVMTHEVGHALESWLFFRQGYDEQYLGMETAETHSMSMEFFAWKYMDSFFGARADDYRLMHLIDSFCFLPYGTLVDHFQHEVYERPDMTPAERNACWNDLEAQYRPYLDKTGMRYLERGTRWQYQMHIYESPFYYIDYCLAQTVALQYLILSLDDYDAAFQNYLAHTRRGGQYHFADLVRLAGLQSPFEDGALATLVVRIEALAARLLTEYDARNHD